MNKALIGSTEFIRLQAYALMSVIPVYSMPHLLDLWLFIAGTAYVIYIIPSTFLFERRKVVRWYDVFYIIWLVHMYNAIKNIVI